MTKKISGSQISRRGFICSSFTLPAGLGIMGKEELLSLDADSQGNEPKIIEYRTLGRTRFKVSDIGFGAGDLTNPEVLAAALDAGVNYIDTAEHYGNGNSERTIGQVMKKRDRKSVFITTKLNFKIGPSTKEGLRDRFLKCLERLQTDYADCLMIHMTPTVDQVKHGPYHELIRELKAKGKVRFTGLSNHGIEHNLAGKIEDDMEKVFLAAAEDGRFDVALFVYNFLQKDTGERILKACKDKNMGATLMKVNPVKVYAYLLEYFDQARKEGREISDSVLKMADEYKSFTEGADDFKNKYGLASFEEVREAAIKFVLNHSGVHSVCPTLNNFDELQVHLKLSGARLKPAEESMLSEYQHVHGRFYCRHACGKCEPSCPYGVPVNTIMRYDHYFRAQGREKHAMAKYAALPGTTAEICSSCEGPCLSACPHNVPIQALLMTGHDTLTL